MSTGPLRKRYLFLLFNFLKIKLDILSATVRCRHIQDVTCFNDRIDKLDNLSVFALTSILLSGCIIKSTICHRAEWFCLKTLTSGGVAAAQEVEQLIACMLGKILNLKLDGTSQMDAPRHRKNYIARLSVLPLFSTRWQ